MSSFFSTLSGSINLLVAVPFLLIALFLGYRVFASNRAVKASENWMTTTGRILATNVEARTSHSSDGGRSTAYYPNIVYEYQVHGQTFQNNQVTVGMQVGRGNYMTVQQQINNYPVGSTVQVYYNPENPAQSALERTAPGNRYLIMAVIFIVVILAITTFFSATIMNMVNNTISGILR